MPCTIHQEVINVNIKPIEIDGRNVLVCDDRIHPYEAMLKLDIPHVRTINGEPFVLLDVILDREYARELRDWIKKTPRRTVRVLIIEYVRGSTTLYGIYYNMGCEEWKECLR